MSKENKMDGYKKMDVYNQEVVDSISKKYKAILSELGENPKREGLLKTPERVAKSLQYLTHGYNLNPSEILNSAKFREDYKQMVIVKVVACQCDL